MSVLTEVVLTAFSLNVPTIDAVVTHDFGSPGRQQVLQVLDSEHAGGGWKVASWTVFQACFRYVPESDVIEWFKGFDWPRSTTAMLVVDGEYRDGPVVLVTGCRDGYVTVEQLP